jgi:phage baseplate assembly protein W
MSQSDRFTIKNNREYFSDFMANFDKNPVTGNLARVTNEDAIKQSLRNLVLTNRTERFYQPHIGSKVQSLLFDPMGPETEDLLRSHNQRDS